GRAEARERGDLALGHERHRRNAGAHGLPIDVDGTGAALTKAATKAWIAEPKLIAQGVEQRHFGIIDGDRVSLAVDVENDILRHVNPSRARFPCEFKCAKISTRSRAKIGEPWRLRNQLSLAINGLSGYSLGRPKAAGSCSDHTGNI